MRFLLLILVALAGLATPALAKKAKREHIYLEQRFSDHAPLVIDYDFTL